jgi:hypothetical protein
MNLPNGLKQKVDFQPKDWIQIGVMVLSLGVVYGGIHAQLVALDAHVSTLDNRMWEMQGERARVSSTSLPASLTCPADATRVTPRRHT